MSELGDFPLLVAEGTVLVGLGPLLYAMEVEYMSTDTPSLRTVLCIGNLV